MDSSYPGNDKNGHHINNPLELFEFHRRKDLTPESWSLSQSCMSE